MKIKYNNKEYNKIKDLLFKLFDLIKNDIVEKVGE